MMESLKHAGKENEYVEKLLVRLVEKYRASKKDAGTNKIVRRTQISPTDLYKDYRKNSGDFARISAVNEAVATGCRLGFVTCEMKGYGNEIAKIYLIDEKVEDVEQYLLREFGYEPKQERIAQTKELLDRYEHRGALLEMACSPLKESLLKNRAPFESREDICAFEDVLKALDFLSANREELYLREASMLIYGESKYFENNTLSEVERILFRAQGQKTGEENDQKTADVLSPYHIRRRSQDIFIRGDLVLEMDGHPVFVGAFSRGLQIFEEDIPRISHVQVRAAAFYTVENWTSYLRMVDMGYTALFLGGFASNSQVQLLRRIYVDNPAGSIAAPGVSYFHFGDIDAGGFRILSDLKARCAIPFEAFCMSKKELTDPANAGCLQPLSNNDRKSLRLLGENPDFSETVFYMLESGVKLEQEIVSLHLFKEGTAVRRLQDRT